MPTFKQNLNKVRTARKAAKAARDKQYNARIKVQSASSPSTLAEVRTELSATAQTVKNTELNLKNAIDSLIGQGDYRKVLKELDGGVPIMLLPVRIETRFVKTGALQELWVRVYPDDIHVHSFESQLTAAEIKMGRAYWLELLRLNREKPEDADAARKSAWEFVTKRVGVQRALWIAKQTQPINWKPTLKVDDADLEFPELDDTKTHDWTRTPRTHLLPDRFAIEIYRGNRRVFTKIGRPVPDTVFMGPDPFLAEEAFKQTGNSIKLDDSFAWTADFGKAVKHGLGFKIKVGPGMMNHNKIDRIVVLGVMASAAPADGKTAVEEHIHGLRYSNKGFSFLPQGSATNNTGRSESGYTKNYDVLENEWYDGAAGTELENLSDSDGLAFAKLLGISPKVLNDARHANETTKQEAQAMNTALYPATAGHYLEVLSFPAVSKNARPKVREFFNRYVSATGPLSSIRVGDQPYGLLLTSDFPNWQEPEADKFMQVFNTVLKILQGKWNTMMKQKVPHVSKSGDANKLLLEILGLCAGSVKFKQRVGGMSDLPISAKNTKTAINQLKNKQNKLMGVIREAGYKNAHMPLVSALTFYQDKSRIPFNYMVDRKVPSATRFLDKNGLTKKNFIQWLASSRSLKDLESHRMLGAKPPRSVLYFLLRHSLLLTLQKAAVNIYKNKGIEYSRGSNEKSLYNFNKQVQDLTSWEVLHGVPKKVDARKLNINNAMGEHVLKLNKNNVHAKELAALRKAFTSISTLSTGRLHQLLADHIDLCSYRLDAWQTGLFHRRLEAQRKTKPEGMYVGAYGWVENIRIDPKTEVTPPAALKPSQSKPAFALNQNAGFVHTPSLNHATMAGLLHAGYVNNAAPDNSDAFAVNLSSERVRRAHALFEGMRNNQSIEALLGYQFERALHDRTTNNPATNLNQYILQLRQKYPIEHAAIPQAGNEAQETVPAYSVVNGLKLVKATDTELRAAGVSSAHIGAVSDEVDRLSDSIDAMADLLTAEGAYQMVQGKTDRMAGVVNSFRFAEKPPELEVDKTPRSTQLTVNNKVCIGFNDRGRPAVATGWSRRQSPRTLGEPGINVWLAEQIGDPRKIVCRVAVRHADDTEEAAMQIALADLEFTPIDFVYAVGIDAKTGATLLEQRLLAHYETLVDMAADEAVSVTFDVSVGGGRRNFAQVLPLARYLRLLLTTGRAANAKDFMPQSKELSDDIDAQLQWDVDELEERVFAVLDALEADLKRLDDKAPNGTQPKTDENPATMRGLFERYFALGKDQDVFEAISVTPSTMTRALEFLQSASDYGVLTGAPEVSEGDESEVNVTILNTVASVWKDINAKLARADIEIGKAQSADNTKNSVRYWGAALKQLLGEDFIVLPGFTFANASDVKASLTQAGSKLLKYYSDTYQTTPALAVDTWLESLAPVRPAVQRLENVRMITEFQAGIESTFTAVQLPFRDNDHWFAMEFPKVDEETGEPIVLKDHTLSMCLNGFDPAHTNRRQHVLMIDEWSEAIPNASEVTGIAYNYNQPNASAPNAVLLAVEPGNKANWDWDVLSSIVNDTLHRAKTRAVEPAHLLEDESLDVLSPMTIAGFDLHEANISLDYLAVDNELTAKMKQANFQLYKHFD